MTIPQALHLALQHQQAGRLSQAADVCRQVFAVFPNHPDALYILGLVASSEGNHHEAVTLIRRAIAINPAGCHYYLDLGAALFAQGRIDEAIAAFRSPLEIKPDFAAAHNNLGTALRAKGDLEEAIMSFRRAAELAPDSSDFQSNLGVALSEKGHAEAAVAACREALRLQPDHPSASYNLGIALQSQGRAREAIAAYRSLLQKQPRHSQALTNLGLALCEVGELDEAIASYRRALEFAPNLPETHNNLGIALRRRRDLEGAAAACRRAIDLRPDYPEAFNNLGTVLKDLGALDDAIWAYRRAIEFRGNYPDATNNLGAALKDIGDLDNAIVEFRNAVKSAKNHPPLHSNLIHTLHFHSGYDRTLISEEHQRWNRRFSDPVKASVLPHTNDRTPGRKLRIGYVSPDLRDHVVGRNLVPLFDHHDHESFEIFCYSGVVQPDELTERFRQCSDHWRDTRGVEDEALANSIRQDGIDVLVDLAQHLEGNRLPMFARKPAPVQVSFAGYPESAGVEAIEYRITDQFLESGPPDTSAGSEHLKTIDSFWCYDPCGMKVKVNALPALGNGKITFGNLNNFCKVTEPMLNLWARVLTEIEESRLLLLCIDSSPRTRTLAAFERHGVDPGRVEFAAPRPRRDYLELYHLIDIVLDTFPYNGHTTSLDALWMGVPVVSLAGQTPVSRAGLSQLTNLGLSKWVARSESEYVDTAVRMAGDFPQLAELRSTLRERMEASVLVNAAYFTRQIEQAYRKMWQSWRSTLPQG